MGGRAHKKGFTLIEIVVALAILVISALFGISSLRDFAVHSEQSARNQVARTIFMAAQTALTQKYNQNRNFSTEDEGGTIVELGNIQPTESITAQERTRQGKIVSLTSNPGDPSDKLIGWLEPQIGDKGILKNSIVVEYNRETGRVLSAFYSDKEGVTLGYGGGSYNVYNRNAADLEAGFVGYYGVKDTGKPIRGQLIDGDDYSIELHDYAVHDSAEGNPYGVLTAEITLPPTLPDEHIAYEYKLTLMPAEGRYEELTFSNSPDVDADFTLDQLMRHSTIEDAIADTNPLMIGNRRIVVYYAQNKLVFVLDCVQSYGEYSQTDNLSIRTNYPNILGGYLDASLEISDGGDTPPVVLYSDDDDPIVGSTRIHALYGGMEVDGGTTQYGIASVRHLNNIRYNTDADAVFSQEADIYFHDYKGEKLNFTPLCNANDPAENEAGDKGFVGRFENGGYNYRMFDLTVDLTADYTMGLVNAGLFDTVLRGGTVSGVRFATTNGDGQVLPVNMGFQTASITGIDAAGGVAAVNYGSISHCTVLGQIVAEEGDNGMAGGIAGKNVGTIGRCAVAARVSGAQYAGGIAGASSGTVQRCEVGTASWRETDISTELFLKGAPYYGANPGAHDYPEDQTANNTFHIEGQHKTDSASGGIVGLLTGNGSKVEQCLNAAKIEAGGFRNGDTKAGGIVGYIASDPGDPGQPVVANCSNAGAVYAPDSAGGLVGRMDCGKLQHSYNTGYVNREFDAKTISGRAYVLPGLGRNIVSDTAGAYKFGGIVGYGFGSTIEIHDCYSAQYSGNRFGGAFGVMNSGAMNYSQITQCCFLKNVLNDTDIYFVETGAIAPAETRVYMLEKGYMRRATSVNSKLDGTYFRDGEPGPAGVGTFHYTYPTFTGNDVGDSHRTPYRNVVWSYGKIHSFTSGASIEAKFSLTPEEGSISFTVVPANGDPEFTIGVGLSQNNFIDLHNVGWGSLTGEDNNHQNYEFYVTAQEITGDPDALYPYQYTIYLNYRSDLPDDIPLYSRLTAKLYNTHYLEGNTIYDEASLGNAITLGNVTTQSGNTTVRALHLDTGGYHNIRIRLNNGSGNEQVISASALDSAPATLEGALNSPTSQWLAFDGTTDRRFPFYVTGADQNRVMHLVLWINGDATYGKSNGLNNVTNPVTVTVEQQFNGDIISSAQLDKLE